MGYADGPSPSDDANNFFGGIGKTIGDIGNNVGNWFNDKMAANNKNIANTWGNPDFYAGSIMGGGGGGTADSGAQAPAAPSPAPDMAPQGSMQQQSLNQSVMDAFIHGISTPAIDPGLMEKAFDGLKSIQSPDYLGLTQNAFKHMQDQVKTMQDQIHGGYDQAKMDIGDIYNSNRTAATMGGNNILQQIAQNEGNAIQGSAQGNMNALANLKNSELAQRAAVAQKGGMPQAAGDNQSNPADVAASGMLANAQAQAAHAQAAAGDRLNSNNQMAEAMGTQNALMQNQLNNNRLGYDSSVGKYMTDLTNQEAQREMDASKQSYADQMQLRSMLYNMNKDAADMNIKKVAAFSGSRGVPAALQDIGIANMDNAKAAATQAGVGNVDPAKTALDQYPQLAAAYNKALSEGIGLPGTKPTYADVYKSMAPMVKGDASINPNDLINFSQMVSANKALGSGSPADMFLSQFQG